MRKIKQTLKQEGPEDLNCIKKGPIPHRGWYVARLEKR